MAVFKSLKHFKDSFKDYNLVQLENSGLDLEALGLQTNVITLKNGKHQIVHHLFSSSSRDVYWCYEADILHWSEDSVYTVEFMVNNQARSFDFKTFGEAKNYYMDLSVPDSLAKHIVIYKKVVDTKVTKVWG